MNKLFVWLSILMVFSGFGLAETASSSGVSGNAATFEVSQFDWKSGNYNNVPWDTLTDFSQVQMNKIPDTKINDVVKNPNFNRWNQLTVSQIKYGQNLDSIGSQLSKLNPNTLNQVIKEKFPGQTPKITIGSGSSLTSGGLLTSAAGGRSVDITKYPKNTQFLVKDNDIEILIAEGKDPKIVSLPTGGNGIITIRTGAKTVEFPDSRKISGTLAIDKDGQIYVPKGEKAVVNQVEIKTEVTRKFVVDFEVKTEKVQSNVYLLFSDPSKAATFQQQNVPYLLFEDNKLSGQGNGFELNFQPGNKYGINLEKRLVRTNPNVYVDDLFSIKVGNDPYTSGSFTLDSRKSSSVTLDGKTISLAPKLSLKGTVAITNDDFDFLKSTEEITTTFFSKKFDNLGNELPRKLYGSVPILIDDLDSTKHYSFDNSIGLYNLKNGFDIFDGGKIASCTGTVCQYSPKIKDSSFVSVFISQTDLVAYKQAMEKGYGIRIGYGEFEPRSRTVNYLTEGEFKNKFSQIPESEVGNFYTAIRQALDPYSSKTIQKSFSSKSGYEFVFVPNFQSGVGGLVQLDSNKGKGVSGEKIISWELNNPSTPSGQIHRSNHEMSHALSFLQPSSLSNWPASTYVGDSSSSAVVSSSKSNELGFASDYGSTRKEEDISEVYGMLMSDPQRLKLLIQSRNDRVLGQKTEIIRKAVLKETQNTITERYPQFSDEFWN